MLKLAAPLFKRRTATTFTSNAEKGKDGEKSLVRKDMTWGGHDRQPGASVTASFKFPANGTVLGVWPRRRKWGQNIAASEHHCPPSSLFRPPLRACLLVVAITAWVLSSGWLQRALAWVADTVWLFLQINSEDTWKAAGEGWEGNWGWEKCSGFHLWSVACPVSLPHTPKTTFWPALDWQMQFSLFVLNLGISYCNIKAGPSAPQLLISQGRWY